GVSSSGRRSSRFGWFTHDSGCARHPTPCKRQPLDPDRLWGPNIEDVAPNPTESRVPPRPATATGNRGRGCRKPPWTFPEQSQIRARGRAQSSGLFGVTHHGSGDYGNHDRATGGSVADWAETGWAELTVCLEGEATP